METNLRNAFLLLSPLPQEGEGGVRGKKTVPGFSLLVTSNQKLATRNCSPHPHRTFPRLRSGQAPRQRGRDLRDLPTQNGREPVKLIPGPVGYGTLLILRDDLISPRHGGGARVGLKRQG